MLNMTCRNSKVEMNDLPKIEIKEIFFYKQTEKRYKTNKLKFKLSIISKFDVDHHIICLKTFIILESKVYI